MKHGSNTTYQIQNNQQEWIGSGGSAPKQPKSQQSTGKIFFFLESSSVLFTDDLGTARAINTDYYGELLTRLKEKIAKNGYIYRKKCIFCMTMFQHTYGSKAWQNCRG